MKNKEVNTNKTASKEPNHIEISVPNDLTANQISILEEISEPYGAVILTDGKIVFPDLPQTSETTGIDLCHMAVKLVNQARGC